MLGREGFVVAKVISLYGALCSDVRPFFIQASNGGLFLSFSLTFSFELYVCVYSCFFIAVLMTYEILVCRLLSQPLQLF